MQIASRKAIGGFTASGSSTVFLVRADGESMTARLASLEPVPGGGSYTIDWDDGTIERLTGSVGRTHTYAKPGRYRIRVSDDISSFTFSGSPSAQSRMLLAVEDVGSRVTHLGMSCFRGCSNLAGVLRFPNVTDVGMMAFYDTVKIVEIDAPSLRYLYPSTFDKSHGLRILRTGQLVFVYEGFWQHTDQSIRDIYARSTESAFLKGMAGFPFGAPPDVRFHCSDGVLLTDGNLE